MNPNRNHIPAGDDFAEPHMRWNGTTRETQPGELPPATPDPAVGVSGFWVGLGLVGAIAAAVACWHCVATWLQGVQ